MHVSQQTQNSWAETDRIPIYKRCNDVRMIQPLGYYSNHVLPDISFLDMRNMHGGWTKYNGNVMAHLPPFQAVCANSDNRIKFILRFIWIKYNVVPKTTII